MVIIIYLVSLASNEKVFFGGRKGVLGGVIQFTALLWVADYHNIRRPKSTASVAEVIYLGDFRQALTFCFLVLLVTLIRVVKLIKLEEGPLVKRLYKI
jgi:hypothetical protein